LLGQSPFLGQLPRDANPRQLRIEAEGYAPESRAVSLDADASIEVTLLPVAATMTSASASAGPAGVASAPASRAPTRPTASAVEPAAPAAPKPLRRTIDEENPYAQ